VIHWQRQVLELIGHAFEMDLDRVATGRRPAFSGKKIFSEFVRLENCPDEKVNRTMEV
jgi:hypothetical protein